MPNLCISAHASVSDVAKSELLDRLTGQQLVIYLRLLAAAASASKSKGDIVITPQNKTLHENKRTVAIALGKLEELGLVRVTYDGPISRSITVRQ